MRRQAINEPLLTRGGIGPDNMSLLFLRGTHACGGKAGTVTFPVSFRGTPTVVLMRLAGSSRMGRVIPLGVTTRQSSQFTYLGSPGYGTFAWFAYGSAPAR